MRALVLAGGKGTRLRPLTDTRPKPLVPFMGAPLAAGLLRRLGEAGCERVTFLAGATAEPFAALASLEDRLGLAVDIATEEVPLDTAGAARRAVAGADEPVLVCNGDILTDLDYRALAAAHADSGALLTIALTRVADPSAFGVVVTDAGGRVSRFVEKPAAGAAPADTVNAGTYVLDPAALGGFAGDGPLSFEREVFPGLLESGAALLGVPSDAYWGDLGTPSRYREGVAAVLDGRCSWPLGSGLEIKPSGVAVHADALVSPGAGVSGPTVVSAGAVVGAGARVEAAVLLEGARIGEGAVIRQSIIAEGAVVGAGATVTGDAVIGDSARVAPRVALPAATRLAPGEHADS